MSGWAGADGVAPAADGVASAAAAAVVVVDGDVVVVGLRCSISRTQ